MICCVAAGAATFAAAQSVPKLPPAPMPKPAPIPQPILPSISSNDPRLKAEAVTAPTKGKSGVKSKKRLPIPWETTAQLTDIEDEPAVIRKMHQMTVWFVPLVSKLPTSYANSLSIRIQDQMYDILDDLVTAESYPAKEKITRLDSVKTKLNVFRHQTWLLLDLRLIGKRDFLHVSDLIDGIETELEDSIQVLSL